MGRVDAEQWTFFIIDLDGGELIAYPANRMISIDWGGLAVQTGREEGPVEVETHLRKQAPPIDDAWTDIEELTVVCGSGLRIQDHFGTAGQTIVKSGGRYRLRISARGRDSAAVVGAVDSTAEPEEHYLIEAWAVDHEEPARVVRAAAPVAETRAPLIHESEGRVAAGRLLNDITSGPGHRSLSGALGRVTVSIERPYARRPLFRFFEQLDLWLANGGGWDRSTGSGFITQGVLTDDPGKETQIVEYSVIESSPPSHIRRNWNWYVSRSPGEMDFSIPVLAVPSELTFDLEQAGDRTDPITTITLTHDRIPAEWQEDLTAFWLWKLEYAEKVQRIGE